MSCAQIISSGAVFLLVLQWFVDEGEGEGVEDKKKKKEEEEEEEKEEERKDCTYIAG